MDKYSRWYVLQATDPAIAKELGVLGIVVQDVDALIGLTCSPVTVIGVGSGGGCSANAVCCQDNSHVSACFRHRLQNVTYAIFSI